MSSPIVELKGHKFGRLTATERIMRGRRTYYKCVCECGNTTEVRADALTCGNVRSCGCLQAERQMPSKIKESFVDGTQISKLTSTPTKANKTGVVGVNWDKSRNKWQASIRFKGRKHALGRFENFDDAVKARKEGEKMFEDFLNGLNIEEEEK